MYIYQLVDLTLVEREVRTSWIKYVLHDEVIKWKHFPRYGTFARRIHRSPVNSPHKGQWRGALIFSLICVWINGWVNNREVGDLRRYHARYDATALTKIIFGHFVLWRISIQHMLTNIHITLQWRNNERDDVSTHWSHDCSGADQRKHQSSASLAFVRGIHRWPVNSPHKWPVTRKMFPSDDVTI